MDAPPIQYCKTSDGVSLAYWSMGEGGTPLVLQPPRVFGHIALEWEDPRLQDWYLHLAERRLIVRYDPRGNGLSERNVADYSLGAFVRDVQSVADRLSLRRFALMSFGGVAPVVMAYAAEFPDRLTRLLLHSPVARTRDIFENPAMNEVLPLLDKDWRLFTETMAHAVYGWERGHASHEWAGFIRRAVTQDAMRSMIDADATASMQRIQAPTLILHPKLFPLEGAQRLASDISSARLLQVDTNAWGDLQGPYVRAVDEFLAEGDEETPPQPADLPSGTAIILFLDIAGSTELTTKLGDAVYREKERALDGALRQTIRDAGGSPVEGKVLGDGVMATFSSAKDAIDAAIKCKSLGDGAGLPLHLGIHAGDVTREGNNVHGGAVQVAARIADASAPGEVLVSDIVRGLARTSTGVSFDDGGERELKGVSEPVRVFAVRSE